MNELSLTDLFEKGRTCYKFSDKKIDQGMLQEIYELMKLGPTSANSCPLRITFITSPEAKARLLPLMMEGNIEKVKSAPVTALFAYDETFYEKMPFLYPINPAFKKIYLKNETLSIETAFRNSTLQAAYFIMIARSLGLDCGPMSGFNSKGINKEFFSNTTYKINFMCNLGYRLEDTNYPRLPKLKFEEACNII